MSKFKFISSTIHANQLMEEYVMLKNITQYETIEDLASIIQEDFKCFSKWIKDKNDKRKTNY